MPPYFFELVWYTGEFAYDPYGGASAAPGGGLDGAAREALGDQFAMRWYSDANHGVAIGLAPGALDAEAARAAIVAELGERFTPEQAAFIAGRLALVAMPYGESALKETAAQLQARVTAALPAGKANVYPVGCRLSDAWRVEVYMNTPITAEEIERVKALVGEFGDQVRLDPVPRTFTPSFGVGIPSIPTSAPPGRPRACRACCERGPLCVGGEHAALRARSCRARARASGEVRALADRLQPRAPADDHWQAHDDHGCGGRAEVTADERRGQVRLQDGTTATRSYTYTRCR